jgi:PPE-repeat protein
VFGKRSGFGAFFVILIVILSASGAELSLPRAYSWYRFVIKRLDEGVAWEGDSSTANVAAVDTEATYLYEIVR